MAIVTGRNAARANAATLEETRAARQTTASLEGQKIDAAAYERASLVYEKVLQQLDRQIERLQAQIELLREDNERRGEEARMLREQIRILEDAE